MSVDAATFRAALGQWPTGVTLVTTVTDGRRHGMTASSFSSVSLEPPLVSVCLARSVFTHDLIATSGFFAVNILAKDQADLGKRFARYDPDVDRFDGTEWEVAKTGAPVLPTALGWLDCTVRHAYPGGDHTIFVGEVEAADTPRVTSPLLYHSRTWGQFADVLPDAVLLTQPAPGAEIEVAAADPASVRAAVAELTAAPDVHARPRVVVRDAFTATIADLAAAILALAPHAPDDLVLADDGTAGPAEVREACREAGLHAKPVPLCARLTDRAGLGQANLLVALKSGVSRIDVGPQALPAESVRHLVSTLRLPLLPE